MKQRVYLETTIPSYLTAKPSRDLIRAAHQQITRDWWEQRRGDFELFVSQIVLQECQAGDAEAAAQRLEAIRGLPLLQSSPQSATLVHDLLLKVPLPERAGADAMHIAIAVTNAVDYLLTWNCTHIANAVLRGRIESVCTKLGHKMPLICTPEQLM